MRIAIVCGKFPATSETFILTQAASLQELGHDVEVFASRRGAGPQHALYTQGGFDRRTHYRPRRGSPRDWGRAAAALLRHPLTLVRTVNPLRFGASALSLRLALSAAPWLDRRPFDAVVCHFGPNGAVASDLRDAGVFEAPMVTIFHGADLNPEHRRRGRRLRRRADRLLVVNRGYATRLVEWGADPERVEVFHMGADLSRFHFREPRLWGDGPVRIVTVARLIPIKGIDVALRALAALPEATRRRIRYDVIGEGPLRPELERLATDLGVEGHVELVGAVDQDEVSRRLNEAHLFILPSVETPGGAVEGMGVALMEAMARGAPVIGSRSGGIPELIADGERGLLAAPGDPQALAERLAWAIDHEDQMRQFARAARAHVEREHDARKQAQRLVDLLERLGAAS